MRPELRRATPNQIAAFEACESALAGCPVNDRLGLVVSTVHGELDVTKEFLGTLAKTGVARPILFQNSLHNAIAGFLTGTLKITGPTLTVSGGNPDEMARLLMEQKAVDRCLVVEVDEGRATARLQ